MKKHSKNGSPKNHPKDTQNALPGSVFEVPTCIKLGPEASRERPNPVQKKRSLFIVFWEPPQTEKLLKTHAPQKDSIEPQTEVKHKNYLSV